MRLYGRRGEKPRLHAPTFHVGFNESTARRAGALFFHTGHVDWAETETEAREGDPDRAE